MRVIGMISGTSFDAVEAVLVDFDPRGDTLACDLVAHRSVPYPDGLRARIAAVLPPAPTQIGEVCELDVAIGQFFAEVAHDLARGGGRRARGGGLLPRPDRVPLGGGGPGTRHASARAARLDRRTHRGERRERRAQPGHRRRRPRGAARERARRPPPRSTTRGRARSAESRGHLERDRARAEDATRSPSTSGRRTPSWMPSSPGPPGARSASTTAGGGRRAVAWTMPSSPCCSRSPTTCCRRRSRPARSSSISTTSSPPSTRRELETDDLVATLAALTIETVARALARLRCHRGRGRRRRHPQPRADVGPAEPASRGRVSPLHEFGVPEAAKEAMAFALIGYLTSSGIRASVPCCTGARHASILGSITPGERPLRPVAGAEAPSRLVMRAATSFGENS